MTLPALLLSTTLVGVALAAGQLGASEVPAAPPPSAPPAATGSTTAPALDPATTKAADAAADAYLATQEPQVPASQEGQNAIADAEVDLLEAHNLIAGHQIDNASTPYLAASKKLNAISGDDRHHLGARFRKDLDDLQGLSQQLLGTSAVDPQSHPPTTPAETKAAEPPAPSAQNAPTQQ